MGRLAKLKRELILESNKRLLGESKSYLTEDEKEKIRLPFIKLVTKYKDALKDFNIAIKLNSKDAELYNYRGRTYYYGLNNIYAENF